MGKKNGWEKIYPPKTKEKDFLKHYVQHYNSIELNATHYKVYGEGPGKKMVNAAGKILSFVPRCTRCNTPWQFIQQTIYYQ